jgi:CBS domain-containing membrane protein
MAMTEHFALTLRSTLARWLRCFSPDPVAIDWPERLRSCLGAWLALSFTAGLTHIAVGTGGVIPLLVAPMGASAVLLFAVPASPLAQPWSLIGGNIVSACVGVLCDAGSQTPSMRRRLRWLFRLPPCLRCAACTRLPGRSR